MKNTIEHIKTRLDTLRSQIETSDKLSQHMPSDYWMEYAKVFDYVFSMREEVVEKIRHHTDMLTSAHPHQYFNAPKEFETRLIDTFIKIQKKLPQYKFTEPEVAGGFGFKYKSSDSERMINLDLLRYMEVFEKLSDNNLLKDNYNIILELGGGFGGLAAQFLINYPKTKYIIVDLPYTLYFSASYLSMMFPERKIYVYKEGEDILLDDYDIFLLPPWGIEEIPDKSVDLAVNQASLGEMTNQQVDYYLNNLNRVTSEIFLSYNRKFNNPWNKELTGLAVKISSAFNERKDINSVKITLKVRFKRIIKQILLSSVMRPFRLMIEKIRGRKFVDGKVGNVYMWMICLPK